MTLNVRYRTQLYVISLLSIFILPVPNAEPLQPLGRVFLSPAERAALDKQREEFYSPPEIEPIEEIPLVLEQESPAAIEESVGPALLVNGFVKRAGTSGTVWINGESTYDGDMANLNVDHLKTKIVGKKVRVTPLDEQAVVYLKPGQEFIPEKGEIASGYQSMGVAPGE